MKGIQCCELFPIPWPNMDIPFLPNFSYKTPYGSQVSYPNACHIPTFTCARNGRRDPRPPLSQEVPGQEKFYLCWNSISQLAGYAPVPIVACPEVNIFSFHFGQRRERREREIHRRNTLQIEEIQGVSLYFSCRLHPRWCSSRPMASRPSSLIRRWALWVLHTSSMPKLVSATTDAIEVPWCCGGAHRSASSPTDPLTLAEVIPVRVICDLFPYAMLTIRILSF